MKYGVPADVGKLVKPAKLFRKSSFFGTTRTVRDNYGPDWFGICKRVRERDKGCCKYCGKAEDHKNGVWHDVHHIIELSRGGLTVMANLCLTCKICHQRKHPHHDINAGRRKR